MFDESVFPFTKLYSSPSTTYDFLDENMHLALIQAIHHTSLPSASPSPCQPLLSSLLLTSQGLYLPNHRILLASPLGYFTPLSQLSIRVPNFTNVPHFATPPPKPQILKSKYFSQAFPFISSSYSPVSKILLVPYVNQIENVLCKKNMML